jgi:hypothetical protein
MADEAFSWSDLANTNISEIERPPLRPQGHYVGVISGKAETGESKKKGTLYATFPVQVQEALDDGDITFWLSPKALWMLTEFGKQMGASDELNVMELLEWLADCGEPIVFQGTHEPNEKNPDRPFFRLQNPVPQSSFQGVSA